LVFSPIAPGQRTANLLVADDAAGSPQTVALSATANLAATVGPAPGGSTTNSVSAGESAQYHLQLTPGTGFSGTISLTCSGAPIGASCQVPADVSLTNGAAAPFTATVTTSGPATAVPLIRLRFKTIPTAPLLPLLAFALLLVIYAKKSKVFEWIPGGYRLAQCVVLIASAFCVIVGPIGCGNTSVPPPPVATPSGTSMLTITPTAKSTTGQTLQLQSIQLTLTVN
jgi:hypothetical protein